MNQLQATAFLLLPKGVQLLYIKQDEDFAKCRELRTLGIPEKEIKDHMQRNQGLYDKDYEKSDSNFS